MNFIKKKILFIVQLPPPVHGVSVMNEIIVQQLKDTPGYDIEIIPLQFSRTFDALRKYEAIKFFRLFSVCFRIKKAMRTYAPDLVYFSFMTVGIGFFRDYFYLKQIKKYRPRIILHLHNRGINRNSQKLIFRHFYQSAFSDSTIIHLSEGLLKKEFGNLKLKNCKLFSVANTCKPFGSKRISSSKTIIDVLFFSNFFPEKGYRIALEAIKHVVAKHPNVRLSLYGQPLRRKYEREILNFIERNNLNDFVKYKGPAFGEEKEKVFLNSDIFIFPSYFREECFPLVILEAMQAGLGIIATKIGAVEEIIEHNLTGLLIKPNNVEELVIKLDSLISNPKSRISMGEIVKTSFNTCFSEELFKQKIISIIHNTIEPKHSDSTYI